MCDISSILFPVSLFVLYRGKGKHLQYSSNEGLSCISFYVKGQLAFWIAFLGLKPHVHNIDKYLSYHSLCIFGRFIIIHNYAYAFKELWLLPTVTTVPKSQTERHHQICGLTWRLDFLKSGPCWKSSNFLWRSLCPICSIKLNIRRP